MTTMMIASDRHTLVGISCKTGWTHSLTRRSHACRIPHAVGGAPSDTATTSEPAAYVSRPAMQQQLVLLAQATPHAAPRDPTAVEGSLLMMTALVALQFIALVGATVTGVLARRRRLELESINVQLRTINTQLRRRREDVQGEALTEALESTDGTGQATTLTSAVNVPNVAAIASLEASLAAPAAPHPTEGFGADGRLSLAGARRRLSACLRCAEVQNESVASQQRSTSSQHKYKCTCPGRRALV